MPVAKTGWKRFNKWRKMNNQRNFKDFMSFDRFEPVQWLY